ncbi:MAG: metallophosphoesterase [Planctomycetota bacterium]|nr:metallophosphoesterase [Planctomycetota bacterium]
MSEFERAKKIIRKMKLPKSAARDQAKKAFHADLGNGLPHKALQCAKEFDLGNNYLTEAATELFTVLVSRARFHDAYKVLKGYNLLEAGQNAPKAVKIASNLDRIPSSVKLEQKDQIGLKKILQRSRKVGSRRLKINDVDNAIEMIRKAKAIRDKDPNVKGRAIILPSDGDVMLCGDFHGNTDNIQKFIHLANLEQNPKRIVIIQEILHARRLTEDLRDLSFDTILYALDLMARYPGQVYYLLGNHDLGFHLGRDLVKAGKSLNRYLYKGMNFQFGDRYTEVADEYKDFIGGMPAAIMTQNGIFMSHSTPKKAFVNLLSHKYFTETSAELPFRKCKPIVALVNGRDYAPQTAQIFADKMGCDHMICGHTPTVKGVKVPNKHHIIIDSQHANARYIKFRLDRLYEHEELVACVDALHSSVVASEDIGELIQF